MKSKVLITGGAGFIGSHLAVRLLSEGYSVIIFDQLPREKAHNLDDIIDSPHLIYYQGDIKNISDVSSVVNEELDLIFHFSAIVGIKKYLADPFEVIDVNITGTKNVLESSLKYNTRVIFSSTSEIYGKNPKVPWSEEDDRVLGPTAIDRWSYSSSKSAAEHLVLALNKEKGLPASIVRYFNVYGPKQNPIFVISKNIHRALNGKAPELYDDGTQTRCFTFIEDAITATTRIAKHAESAGQVYNIGSTQETQIKEVINIIYNLTDCQLKPQKINTLENYGKKYEDIKRRIPEVAKIEKAIGWKAVTPLKDGISKTIDWAKSNPWWLSM